MAGSFQNLALQYSARAIGQGAGFQLRDQPMRPSAPQAAQSGFQALCSAPRHSPA